MLGGLYYHQQQSNKKSLYSCPTDVMACPDGTYLQRTGPNCEFALCKQDVPSYMKKPEEKISSVVEQKNPTDSFFRNFPRDPQRTSQRKVPTTFFDAVTSKTVSTIETMTSTIANTIGNGVVATSQSIVKNSQPETSQSQQPSSTDETRYQVIDNTIVNSSNTPLYTIPQTSGGGGSSTSTWQNHEVNVVPIGQVLPVIGAIPIDGAVGKFYLSENSFGNIEECEFSNRIYILDTLAGTKTLMYEENSSTLSKEDPRACNSEMYLLATEGNKLVMKYHTIGTNMTCDSTWSEPEKTWYLTVDHLNYGTYRYVISYDLYTKAQELEDSCRAGIEGTTTPPTSTSTISG